MTPDFDYFRRLKSLWQQLGGGDPPGLPAAQVSLVNDARHLSSRERAPAARHWGVVAAAAGEHGGFRLGARDLKGGNAMALVYDGQLSGVNMYVFLSAPITEASATEVTPVTRDVDPELTPRIFEVTVATANLPAVGSGVTNVFAGGNVGNLTNPGPIPASIWWPDGNTRWLYVLNATANSAASYKALWQAVRQ